MGGVRREDASPGFSLVAAPPIGLFGLRLGGAAFVQHRSGFLQFQDVHALEIRRQRFRVVQHFARLWSAAGQTQIALVRVKALHDEEPTRFQRGIHGMMHVAANLWREMDEHGHHGIEGRHRPLPICQVCHLGANVHAAVEGKRQRLLYCDRGTVNACHLHSLLGEPDAVATFAVSHRKHLHSRFESVTLRDQEGIGGSAVGMSMARVLVVPKGGHEVGAPVTL